jgi:hypothetical protein
MIGDTQKKDLFDLISIQLIGTYGYLLRQCLHLLNEFQQIRVINYYMHVTFFVVLKSIKRC